MFTPQWRTARSPVFAVTAAALLVLCFAVVAVEASYGDRLPEFKECVLLCKQENCDIDDPTPIPLLHRLLFWTCPAECDYTCQHIITSARVRDNQPVVQFHGKWPFHRLFGMQEPLSVLFSLGNLLAHVLGLRRLRARVPAHYPLRRYYERVGHLGIAAWAFSAIFHARDTTTTERLDYLGAGATVLYGLYYAVVRVFRLDQPYTSSTGSSGSSSSKDAGGNVSDDGGDSDKRLGSASRRSSLGYPTTNNMGDIRQRRRKHRPGAVLRVWTIVCVTAYTAHVLYLTCIRWDYGYNMAANVAVGAGQNALWSYLSWTQYRRTRRVWAIWPGLVVAWIMLAMSLELLDFAPLGGHLDAHSLWHLGTIAPTFIMYRFLIKDSQEDLAGIQRMK